MRESREIATEINGINFQPVLDFAAKRRSSSLVIFHGRSIAAERYFLGWDANAPVSITSASKSIVAVLAGILLKQRAFQNLDQSAAEFLVEWRDDARAAITLRMLLNMTSGLHNVPIWRLKTLPSIGFGLNLGLDHPPGSVWTYNTAAYRLLFLIMQRATGIPLAELCQQELFDPLGMSHSRWLTQSSAAATTEVISIAATAMDLAKFGQLVLQRGVWQGQTLLEPAYIDEALHPAQQHNLSYGFLFWLNGSSRCMFPDAPPDTVAAMGAKYCRLFVIPSRQLVIVRTGERAGLAGESLGNRSGKQNTFDNLLLKLTLEAFAPADNYSTLS